MKTKIVVLNEHTLGYITSDLPNYVQILHSSILKGSPYGLNPDSILIGSGDKLRLASSIDFNEYRVSERGFINPREYEYFHI
jgi:guanyl-specific ribonuclease Sa